MNRVKPLRGTRWAVAAATALLACAAALVAPVPANAMDGAILVVSAADGRIPAPEMIPRIRRALDAAGAQYSETDLDFLSRQAARSIASLGDAPARLVVCASAGSPCVTLVRE